MKLIYLDFGVQKMAPGKSPNPKRIPITHSDMEKRYILNIHFKAFYSLKHGQCRFNVSDRILRISKVHTPKMNNLYANDIKKIVGESH